MISWDSHFSTLSISLRNIKKWDFCRFNETVIVSRASSSDSNSFARSLELLASSQFSFVRIGFFFIHILTIQRISKLGWNWKFSVFYADLLSKKWNKSSIKLFVPLSFTLFNFLARWLHNSYNFSPTENNFSLKWVEIIYFHSNEWK